MTTTKPRALVPNCVLSRRLSFSSFPATIGKKRKRSLQGIKLVKKAPTLVCNVDDFSDVAKSIQNFRSTASLVLERLNHDPNSKTKQSLSSYSREFRESSILLGIDSSTLRGFALAFLIISSLLGYLYRFDGENDTCYRYGKEFHKLNLFWGTTVESLLVFIQKEIEKAQAVPHESLVLDFSDFLITENEEIYFSSLSKILRSGGHKLKSKLKPENIGLLVPGEFLPNHPRELKDSVGLQIAEKSNHLYTWKEAGEQVSSRRKRSTWSSLVSRNIRPRNRSNFPREEYFYSAWDTTFYTAKCEEVLENEYYNQLENSLNNHTKRKQLSMKKIEINKKKKANDTKDSFYFPAFLKRSHSVVDSSKAIELLRQKALSHYRERIRKNTASSNSASKGTSAGGKRVEGSSSSNRTKPLKSVPASSSINCGSNTAGNAALNSSVPDIKKSIKKEESISFSSPKAKIKTEKEQDIAYSNDVLGILVKPQIVLETELDLVKYVHSRAVDLSKIQEQFVAHVDVSENEFNFLKRNKNHNNLTVNVPEVKRFKLDDITMDLSQVVTRPRRPTNVQDAVSLILEELVYKVCCLVFKSIATSDSASTCSEDTSEEYYQNIHSEYLNVAVDVNLSSISESVVMSPRPMPQRRKKH